MTRFTAFDFLLIKLRYLISFVSVRPGRYAFRQMICSTQLRVLPVKHEWLGWRGSNLHWWCLYKTVFKLAKWLYYDAWRVFCDWTGGYRRSYPAMARFVHWIGKSTAGYAISGGRCFHCND